jgi:hypothetical protein
MVKVDIFYEILWPQFKQLREIRNLSESQQIREYNFYLQELELQRIAYLKWLEGRTKGGSEEDNYKSGRYIPVEPLVDSCFKRMIFIYYKKTVTKFIYNG